MSSYNIDEDPYYNSIKNGGGPSFSDSWGSGGDTYGSQSSGGFNFADSSNTWTGTSGETEAADEFGDLEIPEGGFGEPQYFDQTQDNGEETNSTVQQDGQEEKSPVEEIGSSEAQELRLALNTALEENSNLLNQVNAAPKPWPTSFDALPPGDPIRVEINGMLSIATTNYDTLQGNVNYLQGQLDQAIAANGRLQTTINNLNSAPNPLEGKFNEAVATNGRLQATIDSLNSTTNPLDGELNTKNQLINDLQKEIQRLTASESNVKKRAEELETKLDVATQQIQGFQRAIDNSATAANNALMAKQSLLDTAEWKLDAANRKIEALEKELKKPRIDDEVLLHAEQKLAEINVVLEENKKLKRANFKLAETGKKEINRLRDANIRLVLKMGEPERKLAVAQAQLALEELKNRPSPVLVIMEKQEEDDSVPGGWTDNTKVAEVSLPSPADLLAAASTTIKDSFNRKVAYVKEAALHAKFTARHLWNQSKTTIYWILAGLILLLAVAGKDLIGDDTQVATRASQPLVQEIPDSSFAGWVVGGVILVVGSLVTLYKYMSHLKAEAERRDWLEADHQLQAAVQADVLVRQQEEQDGKQKVAEQWQESARQLPPYYFESMRSDWTPPRRIYYGNNL